MQPPATISSRSDNTTLTTTAIGFLLFYKTYHTGILSSGKIADSNHIYIKCKIIQVHSSSNTIIGDISNLAGPVQRIGVLFFA